MLRTFKRIFTSTVGGAAHADVAAWARQQGYGFKRAREVDGFVIDGAAKGRPWRLEWGPPQRAYIEGHELRLRMEVDLTSDIQMLVLALPLMEQLERQTYEQYVEETQTQIGDSTPEEMRWLVMFAKVDLSTLTTIKPFFGAVASAPAAGLAWLEGPLARCLEANSMGLLRGQPPFLLMAMRGRTYLRMQLAQPLAAKLAQAVQLFEIGVEQAVLATARHRLSSVTDWPASASTAWQDLQPQGPGKRDPR